MTAGWLLLAAALLVLPVGGAACGRRAHRVLERAADPSRPPARTATARFAAGRTRPVAKTAAARIAAGRAGVAMAVVATAVACVAVLGIRNGGVAAVLIAPVAGVLIRHAQRRPQRADPDPALPLVLDLVAAALHSGRPVPAALTLAAPAARADTAAELDRVAALCRLGADPAQAWAGLARDGPLGPLIPVAVRSSVSGSKLAAAFERLAAELRAERAAAAAARAHRAGVSALAPLAACFLPSFVCLGVVPVIVSVARTSLGVLR